MAFASLVQSRRSSKRNLLRAALTVAGAFGFAVLTAQVGSAGTAHAAPGLHYSRGYSVQGSWLCYGWSNGSYHCTQRWHRSGGQLVSDNPGWVPTVGTSSTSFNGGTHHLGGAGSQQAPTHSQPAPTRVLGSTSAGEPCRSTDYFNGPIREWWQTPPSCYAYSYAINPRNYVYRPYFGECNWWPEVMNPGRPDLLWGRYPRGTTPRPGATVVFAPGVQGAGGTGHYARVVAVAPGGQWFLVSEMNFYWNGGGFGRVEYRYVHTGAGVSFIY